MSQIKSTFKFLFPLLFYFNLTVYAQFNYLFVKYLSDQNLEREHKTYLAGPFKNMNEDSISYFRAKYYLQYFNDSLFLNNYLKSRNIFNKDTNAFNLASIAFLTATGKDVWFGYSLKDSVSSLANSIRFMYIVSKNPVAVDINDIPEKLQPDFLYYKKSRGDAL